MAALAIIVILSRHLNPSHLRKYKTHLESDENGIKKVSYFSGRQSAALTRIH